MNDKTEKLMAVIDGLESKLEAATLTIETANHTINFLNSSIAAIGIMVTVYTILLGLFGYLFVYKPSQDALNKLEKNMDKRIADNFKKQIDTVIDSLGSLDYVQSSKAVSYLTGNSALIKMDEEQLLKVVRAGRYGNDNIRNGIMYIVSYQGKNKIIDEFYFSALMGEFKRSDGEIDEQVAERAIQNLIQNTMNEDYQATAEMIIHKTQIDKAIAARIIAAYAREKSQILDFLNSTETIDEVINNTKTLIEKNGGDLTVQNLKKKFDGFIDNSGGVIKLTPEEFQATYLYKTWQEVIK